MNRIFVTVVLHDIGLYKGHFSTLEERLGPITSSNKMLSLNTFICIKQ